MLLDFRLDLEDKILMIIIILLKGHILNILIIEFFFVTKIVSKFGDFRDCHVKYHIIFTFHSILYHKHHLLYILNITCEMFYSSFKGCSYAKIHVIENLTMCLKTFKIHMSPLVFFFFGLKFCTNVKNKYEKRIFDHFFFWEKKVIRFVNKLKIMLEYFLIDFGSVSNV
jgi:hypothetical protein